MYLVLIAEVCIVVEETYLDKRSCKPLFRITMEEIGDEM